MVDDNVMAEERRQLLLEKVRADGKVVAAEAAEEYGVSEDSIRRDLRALAAEGLVQRVHGGALPALPTVSFATRAEECLPGPSNISDAAAARISETSGLVLFDNGVTALRVAETLDPQAPITVATASPAIAAAASNRGLPVLSIGGMIAPEIGGAVDTTAVDTLRSLRADTVLLGACALHAEHGITADRPEEVPFKKALIAAASEVIVPAVAVKLGAVSPFAVGPASAVTTLITDAEPDAPAAKLLSDAGIEIINV